jgi:hypothetical protein
MTSFLFFIMGFFSDLKTSNSAMYYNLVYSTLFIRFFSALFLGFFCALFIRFIKGFFISFCL